MKESAPPLQPRPVFPGQRRSACALEAQRAEQVRLRKMSRYERVVLALTLGELLPVASSASEAPTMRHKQEHGTQA